MLHSIKYSKAICDHLAEIRELATQELTPLVGRLVDSRLYADINAAIDRVRARAPRLILEDAYMPAGNYTVRIRYATPVTKDSIRAELVDR